MHALGYNYRMTDLQAALGVSQMDKLDDFVARRREIAAIYNDEFKDLPGLVLPHQHPNANSSWHLYVLRWLPEYFTASRKVIFEKFREMNIGVNIHYYPVYLQPYYQSLGYEAGICPEAEHYYETSITLPLFPKMREKDIDDVCTTVKLIFDYYRN
ncbi:UDP-4-amino-4,6-dideoxy-N-acetyl-beta-L-altrosamine transaminase [compost metagenome]